MPILIERVTRVDERRMAALTHVASIFFPIVGPGIAYSLFRRKSEFVSFHAMVALFDAIIFKAFLLVGGLVSLGFTIARISDHIRTRGAEITWDVVWPILIRMGITWLVLAILGFVLSVQSLFQAYAAYNGKWKGGAMSGRLALKALALESKAPANLIE